MTEQSPQSYLQPDEVEAVLGMGTTGDLAQRSNQEPVIDLSRLTTYEIVSAIHAVWDADFRLHQENRRRMGHPAEPVQVEDVHRRLALYSGAMDTAVDHLPGTDPEKTRDVFTILAGSSSVRDREYAGSYIGLLTQVDRDYGLELWQQLLNDDHADVADAAWRPVESLLGDVVGGHEQSALEDGITRDDLLGLASDYVRRLTHLRRDAEGLPRNP